MGRPSRLLQRESLHFEPVNWIAEAVDRGFVDRGVPHCTAGQALAMMGRRWLPPLLLYQIGPCERAAVGAAGCGRVPAMTSILRQQRAAAFGTGLAAAVALYVSTKVRSSARRHGWRPGSTPRSNREGGRVGGGAAAAERAGWTAVLMKASHCALAHFCCRPTSGG